MASILSYSVETGSGESINLEQYKGMVLLIVNTASKCGFTPQYKGLEALYKKYKEQGFQILGFPCNQFGKQEPGANDEIKEFCELNFGVTFPLLSKVDVNGDAAHPLFVDLKQRAPGILGTQKIKWNFTKFLVNREGNVIKRFAPKDKPESLEGAIAALL